MMHDRTYHHSPKRIKFCRLPFLMHNSVSLSFCLSLGLVFLYTFHNLFLIEGMNLRSFRLQ